MIRVSVLGATGYTGAELLRLLSAHPEVEIVSAASRSFAGKTLDSIYSNFQQAEKIGLINPEELAGQTHDLVFLCLPHGKSMDAAKKLLASGVRVIDLSADFRYRSSDLYEEWYGTPHTAKDENETAVYGLPEYYAAQIQNANLVANPGCYSTAAILALTPLLKEKLIEADGIVVNAASGVTGAGRKSDVNYSFCEVDQNYKAYAPVRHRHTSEIEEELSLLAGAASPILFTPHLLPVRRGILETIYAMLTPGTTAEKVEECMQAAYKDAVFTHFLSGGLLPELKAVTGSNNCLIGAAVSGRTNRLIVNSALDNLIKGAAGQAVQNMNLMFGLAQDAGLPHIASYL